MHLLLLAALLTAIAGPLTAPDTKRSVHYSALLAGTAPSQAESLRSAETARLVAGTAPPPAESLRSAETARLVAGSAPAPAESLRSAETARLVAGTAPAPAESLRSAQRAPAAREIDHGPRFYPSPLYSTSAGFGFGLGYEVRNLLAAGTRLLTRNTVAQHLGIYTLSIYTGDPTKARAYGVVNGYYGINGRHWFYGLGPASDRSARIAVEKRALEAEVRGGFRPPGRPFHVQPFARYSRQEVLGYEPWREGGLERLDEAARANLFSAAGDDDLGLGPVVSGIFLGAVAGVDTRDRQERTTRGLLAQATFERFVSVSGDGIRFDRFGAVAYGFVPLSGAVLALRAASMLTRNRAETPVPFYHLPNLDGPIDAGFSWNRYTGNDLLVFSAEYRRPLMQVLGIAGVDVMATLSIASVYDDVLRQFSPGITLDPQPLAGNDRYRMHPVAGIGGRVVALDKDNVIVHGSVTLDAEGFSLTSLRVVYDLRGLQLSRR